MIGTIFDIKEMAVHDGPGLRTTVFMKGCPLRCIWCHNPEGLTSAPQLMYKEARCKKCGLCSTKCSHPECAPFGKCINMCPENCLQISGKTVDSRELAEELLSGAKILGNSFGGFTFSGGEPLAQPEFLLEMLQLLKGHHLCIETSGYTDEETFREVLSHLDYVMMDLKLADSAMHKKFTGVSNDKILKNLDILRESGLPCVIRTPLIPGITDTEENLTAIKKLVAGFEHELLPYNDFAEAKYQMLDIPYPYKDYQNSLGGN